MIHINEKIVMPEEAQEVPALRRLGKLEVKGHMNQLVASDYLKITTVPDKYDFWSKRKPIPHYDTGNNEMGNCTRASQALLAQYMERLEQKRTIKISKEEIVRVYVEMSERRYGGGDNGAYELDALNDWRNPEFTFRDYKGRPMTIDAYIRVNHFNIQEIKKALYVAGAKGIKLCFNMPLAWAYVNNRVWDIPEGVPATGKYQPNSWGGHSTSAISKYDEGGVTVLSSWNEPPYYVTWRAIATYASECYMVIDSFNQWKKRLSKKEINLDAIRSDVNSVSDIKIK